jgi:hypothetical protein
MDDCDSDAAIAVRGRIPAAVNINAATTTKVFKRRIVYYSFSSIGI